MDDTAWVEGMADLVASLQDREMTPELQERRGELYRRELQGLSNHQWRWAVAEAIRTERWIPAVSVLLDLGHHAPPPVDKSRMLPAPVDECPLCEDTGWELFEQDGYTKARYCERGCKPLRPEEKQEQYKRKRHVQRAQQWSARNPSEPWSEA